MFQVVVGAVAYVAAAYWLARATTDDPADRLRYVLHYLAELYLMVVGVVMIIEFALYRTPDDVSLGPTASLIVGTFEYAALWGGALAFPGAILAFFAGNIMEEVRGRVELPRIALRVPLRLRESAAEEEGGETAPVAQSPWRQDSIIRIDNRKRRSRSLEV